MLTFAHCRLAEECSTWSLGSQVESAPGLHWLKLPAVCPCTVLKLPYSLQHRPAWWSIAARATATHEQVEAVISQDNDQLMQGAATLHMWGTAGPEGATAAPADWCRHVLGRGLPAACPLHGAAYCQGVQVTAHEPVLSVLTCRWIQGRVLQLPPDACA